MHKNKLVWNTSTALFQQVATVICGFILPRMILKTYGSSVNGLISSITQFVGIISFLELGVGSIVQSALYAPLSKHDTNEISMIWVSANRFFKNLARILLAYIILLICIYPKFVEKSFDIFYTSLLIAAMSISWFSQYYFGIVNGLVLKADQRGYVLYLTQSITLILNTIACCILMTLSVNIQMVKLTTSVIYLCRPLILYIYVKNHYCINKKISYSKDPIKQKWNGVAQHVAAVVLDGTDTIVLTVFSTLESVSIYSVYYLVVSGLRQLFLTISNPIQAAMGALWVQENKEPFMKKFRFVEWSIHTLVDFVFGCTFILIVPFVKIYTSGVHDTNYDVPLFAALIVIANICFSLKMPYYEIAVKACNHYKQTQRSFVIATTVNIVVSIATVYKYGLIGVAIGTIIAMLYQLLWMANYVYKNILHLGLSRFWKQLFVDVITLLVGIFLSTRISFPTPNIFLWVVFAIGVAIEWIVVIATVNFILYKNEMIILLKKLRKEGTE
ncbi:Membrane protein involved in the export of O-antigen and teichoic acid [Kandleria vitulina]|uniref:Membrane protein involved in the export of O-antigen and teichoic acid n=1 Tax=Kandleria vitulina TaxID=1630 RepID=A0A1H2VNC6_9FIRM|nr:polysaccharide biosynthesis C-terminal domain-containing protein [Kandleria vitulina]SDW69843.1 Membrane protein involved in the export of O-antigen and teichoic acid [Kandleria vitulina]